MSRDNQNLESSVTDHPTLQSSWNFNCVKFSRRRVLCWISKSVDQIWNKFWLNQIFVEKLSFWKISIEKVNLENFLKYSSLKAKTLKKNSSLAEFRVAQISVLLKSWMRSYRCFQILVISWPCDLFGTNNWHLTNKP